MVEKKDNNPIAPKVEFVQKGKSLINVSVKIALGDKVFELDIDEVDRLAKILNKLCGLLVFNPTDLINLNQPKQSINPGQKKPVPNQTVPNVIGGTIPQGLQQIDPSQ